MTEDQVAAFLAVHQTGSFNKAAAALYLTQPTITHRIRQLELDLDVTLFLRRRAAAGVQLSEAGRTFLPHAEAFHALCIQAREELARYHTRRTLTIGFTSAMMDGSSAAYFQIMQQLAPRLGVTLHAVAVGKPHTQKEQLLSGEIDVLMTDLSAELWQDSAIGHQVVFNNSARAYLHGAHPLAQRKELTLEELSGQALYRYEDGTFLLDYLHRSLQAHHLPAAASEDECTSLTEALLRLTPQSGILVVNIPQNVVPSWVCIPLEKRITQPIGLVWCRRTATPLLREVIAGIAALPPEVWRK